MTPPAKFPIPPQHLRTLQTVAGIVVALLLISQMAGHGSPMTDKSDPTRVFSVTLSDRAVLCLSQQGSVVHPTKCRPDTGNPLPDILSGRSEAVRSAGDAGSVALHLAFSSRKLLLLKSHLLI